MTVVAASNLNRKDTKAQRSLNLPRGTMTCRGRSNLLVEPEVGLPIPYRGVRIDTGFRLDLLVEKLVVVEIKAVERLLPVHDAQLLTYLKLFGHRLGLLINFNVVRIKDGLRRFVNS